MEFYLNVQNNKIINASNKQMNSSTVKSYKVEEQVYYDFLAHEEKYKVQNGKIVVDENYVNEQKELREKTFKQEFFETSLGWIRREPTLANGTVDNFLNNNLPLFAITLAGGRPVALPVAYKLPDFSKELTEDYMKFLQILNQPITQQFIDECMQVKMKDFTGQVAQVNTPVINEAE